MYERSDVETCTVIPGEATTMLASTRLNAPNAVGITYNDRL